MPRSAEEKKEWVVKVWYPMSKDKTLDANFKFIHLINNGMEYITSGVDSNVNVVTKKFCELTECIDSGLDICQKLYSELPKCEMQRALLAIKRELTAASSLASSTQHTIGTANLAVLKAPPTPVIPSSKQPPTRNRGAPSSTSTYNR